MNFLTVNGVEMNVPLNADASFQELLGFLRETLVTEKALISCVRVNGSEINESDELAMRTTPLSDIQSVEIATSHPKEIADETLRHLSEYSEILENLSLTCAGCIDAPEFHGYFVRLVEGISTFTDALWGVKKILRVGLIPQIQVLETDLLSILKDLLSFHEKNETQFTQDLLSQHLPINLRQWREEGLPFLVRLRDS
jgi:hypothetical protein